MPNELAVKNGQDVEPVRPTAEETPPEDELEKEPPTPTNCQPPSGIPVEGVDSLDVAQVTPSDSVHENGLVVEEEPSDDDSSETDAKEDATSDFDSDSEVESSDPPYQALNHYVALPSVVVEDETPVGDPVVVVLPELQGPSETADDHPQRVQPQLAVQEDFDLSPTNEAVDVSDRRPSPLVRARSKESIDSSKFAMTETEFSDWADNSLGGDLDAELDIDPEPVKQTAVKEQMIPSLTSPDTPVKSLNNGASNLDDIEFADDSEGRIVDLKGYTKLVEEIPTPDKPTSPPVSQSTFIYQFHHSSRQNVIFFWFVSGHGFTGSAQSDVQQSKRLDCHVA